MSAATLSAISFLAFFFVIIPVPWHWRAKNIATLSTIFWLASGDLFDFIKSILWAHDVVIRAEVWCDISIFFFNASALGLPAAGLCITRHLESVSSPRYSVTGLNDKRRRVIFELFMCIVLPILYSLMHMIVQGHRFDIFEELGCTTTTYFSWPAIFLFYVPPVIIALISSVYAGFALRWFIQRRAQFREVLSASKSGLTTARYFRLMGLALTEMCAVLGLSLYIIVANAVTSEIRPWVSWAWVHEDFSRIDQYPKVLMPPAQWRGLLTAWMLIPVSSFVFFAFFGFGEEAMAEYTRYWRWIKLNILRMSDKQPGATLPSYITHSVPSKLHEMSGVSRSGASDIESKWDTSDIGSILESQIHTDDVKDAASFPEPAASLPAPPRTSRQFPRHPTLPAPTQDIIVSLSRSPSLDSFSSDDASHRISATVPASLQVRIETERRVDF